VKRVQSKATTTVSTTHHTPASHHVSEAHVPPTPHPAVAGWADATLFTGAVNYKSGAGGTPAPLFRSQPLSVVGPPD
jgi:hypothetical protein